MRRVSRMTDCPPGLVRRAAMAALLAALLGCAAPLTQRVAVSDAANKAEADRQQELAVRERVAEQRRLSSVYFRLATKASGLCPVLGPYLGLFAMSRPDGESGAAFERVYKIQTAPTILFVDEGGPAARAGVAAGDVITKVNDLAIADIESLATALEGLQYPDTVRLRLQRDKKSVSAEIAPVKACKYPTRVVQEQSINAFADGERIMIARGMMSFTRDDVELALVVAHEMAHNTMRHIDSKMQNAGLGLLADIAVAILTRGQVAGSNFSQIGAAAYSQEFEAEADYVGLYILANAGVPIDEAPKFWRRMAVAHPSGIRTNHAASHPSTAYRMVALEAAVKEIKDKISKGLRLMPNMKDGKPHHPGKPPEEGGGAAK